MKEGRKAIPFNYSGRVVVGVKTYQKLLKDELERVKTLRGQWGKLELGDGYLERYGAALYEVKLKETVDKKFCNVVDIMNHVVLE